MKNENRSIEWMEWFVRIVSIGVASLAVNYLKDIGKETAMLSMQFLELKYEIKRLADVNLSYSEKLQKIEERLTKLEEKKK